MRPAFSSSASRGGSERGRRWHHAPDLPDRRRTVGRSARRPADGGAQEADGRRGTFRRRRRRAHGARGHREHLSDGGSFGVWLSRGPPPCPTGLAPGARFRRCGQGGPARRGRHHRRAELFLSRRQVAQGGGDTAYSLCRAAGLGMAAAAGAHAYPISRSPLGIAALRAALFRGGRTALHPDRPSHRRVRRR